MHRALITLLLIPRSRLGIIRGLKIVCCDLLQHGSGRGSYKQRYITGLDTQRALAWDCVQHMQVARWLWLRCGAAFRRAEQQASLLLPASDQIAFWNSRIKQDRGQFETKNVHERNRVK